MSFNSAGCFPVSNTILALPRTDCAANEYACVLGIPASTAASAIASINMKTYAGELPLTPTTASIRCSDTTLALPKLFIMSRASFSSSLVALLFKQIAVHPSPTKAGVFGIQRTKRICFANPSSIQAMLLPATMEIISLSIVISSLISVITSGKKIGLTANTMISEFFTTSLLST